MYQQALASARMLTNLHMPGGIVHQERKLTTYKDIHNGMDLPGKIHGKMFMLVQALLMTMILFQNISRMNHRHFIIESDHWPDLYTVIFLQRNLLIGLQVCKI